MAREEERKLLIEAFINARRRLRTMGTNGFLIALVLGSGSAVERIVRGLSGAKWVADAYSAFVLCICFGVFVNLLRKYVQIRKWKERLRQEGFDEASITEASNRQLE